MNPLRYAYIELSNEQRLKKIDGNKRHRKTIHELYLNSRRTMIWRLKHFAKKQKFECVVNQPLMYTQ